MTTMEETQAIASFAAVQDYFLTRRIKWPMYQALLDAWGPRAPRHTYDRGVLEIMAKSSIHEVFKSLLASLCVILLKKMRLPYVAAGEPTLFKERLDRGVEPDHCFWIANAARVRGKVDFDFEVDPPPDLFLEIEISRTVVDRLSVLAALGVPEVWRFDSETLEVGVLQGEEGYVWGKESPSFPGIPIAELASFLKLARTEYHSEITERFETWVEEQLEHRQ